MLSDRAARYAAAVCEQGSIRAAARRLGIAPSAVQRTLAAAERDLGVALFDRGARGVAPTEAGLAVARHARERNDLDRVLADRLAALRGLEHGRVAIATGESFVHELWHQVLGDYLDQHPGVRLRVVTTGSDGIVDLLVGDEVDLAIALHPRPEPASAVVASMAQPLRVVCRPDHRFAALASVHPRELVDQPLALLPPQFGLRSLHDQLARTHGLVLHHRLVTESQPGIAEALLTGHAVAVLPPVTVARHLESGQLVAVALQDPQVSAVQAHLMVRRGRRLSAAARSMVAACRDGLFPPG